MRCHEVLGVRENASKEEIERAFSQKQIKITENKDVLGTVPYKLKIQELNSAKEECLAWREKSFPARTMSRVSEFSAQATSSNRLNTACIGPISCCDFSCGVLCCDTDCAGTSGDYGFCAGCLDCCGCCEESFLGYTPTIWCDAALYIFMIWTAYRDLKDKREKKEREYRIQKAEKAKADNERLKEQLNGYLDEQRNLRIQLVEEEKRSKEFVAFLSLLNVMGEIDNQSIIDNQNALILSKKSNLDKTNRHIKELQEQISKNQQIIDAGNI